jgi:hypothetical protein
MTARPTLGEKFSPEKNPEKKFAEIFFLNRGIIIAPRGRGLYTRAHDSIA